MKGKGKFGREKTREPDESERVKRYRLDNEILEEEAEEERKRNNKEERKRRRRR